MSWLGFFYGGNIGGGVLGCLLAGFYLLRVHDSLVATYVAVALNVLVAVVALAHREGDAAYRGRRAAGDGRARLRRLGGVRRRSGCPA